MATKKKVATREQLEYILWKQVSGYEGSYEVSNTGIIKSMYRQVLDKSGKRQTIKGKILSLKFDKDGYAEVGLNKNNKSTFFRVHRLVASAFIPNPESKPLINHLNGVKNDNRVNNLEWSTVSENTLHGFHVLNRQIHNKRKINQYDINGKLLKQWLSITEAAEGINVGSKTFNRYLIKSSKPHYHGFIWKYAS